MTEDKECTGNEDCCKNCQHKNKSCWVDSENCGPLDEEEEEEE
jgi:hypothetical protein